MNKLGDASAILFGCIAGIAIGTVIVFILRLGNFWGFNLLLKSAKNGRLLYAVLAWFAAGLLAELLWRFFCVVIKDFYPVLPKEKLIKKRNLVYSVSIGLISWVIIFIYINGIRKSIRGDSDDTGGNFIRTLPDSPVGSKSKTKIPPK